MPSRPRIGLMCASNQESCYAAMPRSALRTTSSFGYRIGELEEELLRFAEGRWPEQRRLLAERPRHRSDELDDRLMCHREIAALDARSKPFRRDPLLASISRIFTARRVTVPEASIAPS